MQKPTNFLVYIRAAYGGKFLIPVVLPGSPAVAMQPPETLRSTDGSREASVTG